MTEYLQQLLEHEREAIVERDEVGARKRAVDEQIRRLSQPGGSEDPAPECAGGDVLAACCCPKSLLLSALMMSRLLRAVRPSRHAIVVPESSRSPGIWKGGWIDRKISI
ncbi:hypothetical protein ACNKHQ_05420 [Shigella flexneri]